MSNEFQFSNLVWLHCDLQLRGKAIIRHGKRKEVTMGEKWIFCPLLHFPRDRISIKTCEKCPHFKGYSKIEEKQGQVTSQYIGKKLKESAKIKSKEQNVITGETIDKAIRKIIAECKKWNEDEAKRVTK